MKVLLLTAPMVQLNTPYPATAYLAGFLRLHAAELGLEIAQADPALELFLRLFSREGLARVRAALCSNLAWLGIKLDAQANAADGPRISAPDSAVSVWVIPTNEELMIAQHTLALVRP